MWPAYGTIVRAFEQKFVVPHTGKVVPATYGTSVVRAVSKSEAPKPGTYEMLDNGTFRYAFMYGFCRAVEAQDEELIAEFQACALRFPVSFEFLPDEDAKAVRKIQCDVDRKADVIFAGLHGYKVIKVYAGIQKSLRDRNLPCQASHIYDYLISVRWQHDDKPDSRKIEQHLKINGRLTPETIEMLDCCESWFGQKHVLASVTALDTVMARTSCKQPELQGRPAWNEVISRAVLLS